MLYDCRDIGVFLEVSLVWCRTPWPRVGNNIDSRDNRLVYGNVALPL